MNESVFTRLEKIIEESYKDGADTNKLFKDILRIEDYFIKHNKSFPFLLYAAKENIIRNGQARTK